MRETVEGIVYAVLAAIVAIVLIGGMFWFFWDVNNTNAQKSKELQLACIENQGVWLDRAEACTWTP